MGIANDPCVGIDQSPEGSQFGGHLPFSPGSGFDIPLVARGGVAFAASFGWLSNPVSAGLAGMFGPEWPEFLRARSAGAVYTLTKLRQGGRA